MEKRKSTSTDAGGVVALKRQRTGDVPDGALVLATAPRTSSLSSPTMLLSGHGSSVNCVSFDPRGEVLLSGSHDKTALLWRVHGECENIAVLSGHKNALLGVAWNPKGTIMYTASADKTAGVWDAHTLERTKKMSEHTEVVNAISASPSQSHVVATCSDDGTCKLWDVRVKRSTESLEHKYQVTSVSIVSHLCVATGSIDNVVRLWDTRTSKVLHHLKGHSDTITGLCTNPDGTHVLSNSMDNSLRTWDVRSFTTKEDRCVRTFSGVSHGLDQNLLKADWSADGSMVAAGSADRMVHVWDATTGAQLYRLPGHSGTVNQVAFHPDEPIIASASSDRQIYLGELNEGNRPMAPPSTVKPMYA